MSNGGVSVPGGLGGVGGAGEMKPLRGIDDVGAAPESDAALKFQTTMGAGGVAGKEGVPVSGTAGPYDFQSNRIKDSDVVSKSSGLMHTLVKGGQKLTATVRAQEQEITSMTKKTGKGLTATEMMELQFKMGQYGVFLEMIAKAAGKLVQNVTTVVKNQ